MGESVHIAVLWEIMGVRRRGRLNASFCLNVYQREVVLSQGHGGYQLFNILNMRQSMLRR